MPCPFPTRAAQLTAQRELLTRILDLAATQRAGAGAAWLFHVPEPGFAVYFANEKQPAGSPLLTPGYWVLSSATATTQACVAECRIAWQRLFPNVPWVPLVRDIAVLCGSTRFYETYQAENLRLTLAGYVVLSIGYAKEPDGAAFAHLAPAEYEAVKAELDHLHLDKLLHARMVGGSGSHCLILNVGGYIGESTARELAFARAIGLPVQFLEPQ